MNWTTTDESFRNYFSTFGELSICKLIRDENTKRVKIGFIEYRDRNNDSKVVNSNALSLDGRSISVRVALQGPMITSKIPTINRPKPRLEMNDILKYINSFKYDTIVKLSTNEVRIDEKNYKFDRSSPDFTVVTMDGTDVNPLAISKPLLMVHKEGLIPYDPSQIFSVDTKILIQYNHNLGQLEKPIELAIPVAPESTRFQLKDRMILFYHPYTEHPEYDEKVTIFRLNPISNEFEHDGKIERNDFFINSADCNALFNISSRLPYNPREITMDKLVKSTGDTVNRVIEEQKQQEDRRIAEQKEKEKEILAAEENKRIAEENENKRKLALEESKRIAENKRIAEETENKRKLALEESKRALEAQRVQYWEDARRRDPVDLAVYDTAKKQWVRILEYHKAADKVMLDSKFVYIWYKPYCHKFELLFDPAHLKFFDETAFPCKPEKMCDFY